jgi:hypothetical protein
MNKAITKAVKRSTVFLLIPYECPEKRAEALLDASEYVRAAVKGAVRGGRDDLALKLVALAQKLEAGALK